jgi:hypothetical protein
MHAIALLSHVADHPREHQSLRTLSDKTGVPVRTLRRLIDDVEWGCRPRGGPPVLDIVSSEFGYSYKLHRDWHIKRGRGTIIEAERKTQTP